jgi:hypothetical protein
MCRPSGHWSANFNPESAAEYEKDGEVGGVRKENRDTPQNKAGGAGEHRPGRASGSKAPRSESRIRLDHSMCGFLYHISGFELPMIGSKFRFSPKIWAKFSVDAIRVNFLKCDWLHKKVQPFLHGNLPQVAGVFFARQSFH